MKLNKMKLAIAVCSGLALIAGISHAEGWPASVAGTWTVVGANTEGTMVITQSNAPSGSHCCPINVVLYGADNCEGWYNPSSGRILFIRYYKKTSTAIQFWSGNLTIYSAGKPLRIGGGHGGFPARRERREPGRIQLQRDQEVKVRGSGPLESGCEISRF